MLDDHPVVVMAWAVIAVHFGTRVETVMMTVLDDNGFSAGNRRYGDGDRANGRYNVSKLVHMVLLG
jgi:hypothetical protein